MPSSRAVSWKIEPNRGHNVWQMLCRAALRGVDLAAAAFGVKDADGRVERAEPFSGYGLELSLLLGERRPIDWAKLTEVERERIAREMKP